MDNLLTKLYYGQIDISNKKPKTERSNEETELFDKLEQSLTKEQFELFQEFLQTDTRIIKNMPFVRV